jgi:hypothetical protein
MKKEASLLIAHTNSSEWAWQLKFEEALSSKLSDGFEIESIILLEHGKVLYTLVRPVNPEED